MAFHVPMGCERLFESVRRDYMALVRANVVSDVFTASELATWLGNFSSDEERYLAAKMLAAAVIRSNRMIESSLRQIVDILAPHYLRAYRLHDIDCLDTFEKELRKDIPSLPIRFMAVDGARLDRAAANSGEAILRKFTAKFRIGDGYRLRADDQQSFTPGKPTLLVLLDDLLGTGTQISRFLREYQVMARQNVHVVYAPLLATASGIIATMKEFEGMVISPIEELSESAGFFYSDDGAGGVWTRDGVNLARESQSFYTALCAQRRIGEEGRYSKSLTVLLPDRFPNNSLGAFWKDSEQWHPLKYR